MLERGPGGRGEGKHAPYKYGFEDTKIFLKENVLHSHIGFLKVFLLKKPLPHVLVFFFWKKYVLAISMLYLNKRPDT